MQKNPVFFFKTLICSSFTCCCSASAFSNVRPQGLAASPCAAETTHSHIFGLVVVASFGELPECSVSKDKADASGQWFICKCIDRSRGSCAQAPHAFHSQYNAFPGKCT